MKQISAKIIFSLLGCILLSTSTLVPVMVAQADEIKIATVDIDRLINESKFAAEKRKTLDAITKKKKAEVDAKRTALKTKEEALKKAKVSEDSKEADQFRSEARDLARLVKDSEDAIKNEYVKTTKELMKVVMAKVEGYAKANQIGLVLEKSDRRGGNVLYGQREMDITEPVLKLVNQG